MENRFFIWPKGAKAASEINPGEIRRSSDPSNGRYFCCVIDELDRRFADANITFLITWNLDLFDDRFAGAVVLLIGDEMYQNPSYLSRVQAVFKTGGLRSNPIIKTLQLPFGIAWRVALRDLRNHIVSIRRRRAVGRTLISVTPTYEIPLGTYSLEDVPFVPFEKRETGVFFAGTFPSAGTFSVRPSVTARKQMAVALREAETSFPALGFVHALTTHGMEAFSPKQYSNIMMNARIALCPRGNFDETFRLFEAAKSSCVIVTEPLPERWYYQNAPVVQLRGWRDLVPTFRQLLAEPVRLQELSHRTGEWWIQQLSEQAVAKYAGDRLAGTIRTANNV